MATGRKSKSAKKLQSMHDYLHDKVQDVEKERVGDRSYNHKVHLVNLKKQKLAIKDQIASNDE